MCTKNNLRPFGKHAFYLFYQTHVRSFSTLVLTDSCWWDLTDVTLADEDDYSVLVDDLPRAMLVQTTNTFMTPHDLNKPKSYHSIPYSPTNWLNKSWLIDWLADSCFWDLNDAYDPGCKWCQLLNDVICTRTVQYSTGVMTWNWSKKIRDCSFWGKKITPKNAFRDIC